MQADQLFFQQRQGLGHADQDEIERAADDLAGGHEGDAAARQAVARQVLLQGQVRQVGIAAAGHPHMGRQRGGQGTEAVVEHQHPRVGRQRLLMQVCEQVFVGGVEGLQRLVGLLGLTDQVEAGEGRFKNRHRN